MSTILLMVAGAIIVGVVIYGVISFVRGRKDTVQERLEMYSEGAGAAVPQDMGPSGPQTSVLTEHLERALEGRGFTANIRAQLAGANLRLTASEFLSAVVIAVILFAALAHMWRHNAVITLGAAVLGFFAPRWYISYLQAKRLKDFNNQLGDTINLLVNSIRSGYSVLQAMEAVSQEMGPPIADEFGRVVREVQLGVTLEDAIELVVGEIHDEFDRGRTPDLLKVPGGWSVAGHVSLRRLEREVHQRFDLPDDIDSIGGLVAEMIGREPRIGDRIEWQGLDFCITELDENRPSRLLIEVPGN